MKSEQVIVEGPYGTGGQVRVAAVISQDAGGYLVRWEPGGAEEDGVRLGPNARLAVRGSLRHDFLVDPAGLRASFAADPAAVVLRELREKGKRLTAAQLRENLVGYGLGKDQVSESWPGVSKVLLAGGVVKTFGEKTKRTFLWIGGPADDTPAQPPAAVPVPEPSTPVDAGSPDEQVAAAAERIRAGARPAVDLTAIADVAANLPLTPRVTLIRAIDKAFPGQVADGKWWHGVTLAELADAATGPLDVVIARPAVVDRVLQPLIIRELAAASSLPELGDVLAAAARLVQRLDATAVATAVRRIAHA